MMTLGKVREIESGGRGLKGLCLLSAFVYLECPVQLLPCLWAPLPYQNMTEFNGLGVAKRMPYHKLQQPTPLQTTKYDRITKMAPSADPTRTVVNHQDWNLVGCFLLR